MSKNVDFIWKMNTDAQLRRWPRGNTAVNLQGNHLKTSFMPREKFNSKNGIRLAPALEVDVLGKRGIEAMGFAEHSGGYYHSRVNKGFFDILYVLDGTLKVAADNLKASVKKGGLLALPPNLFCTSSVECKKTVLMWFHLSDSAFWRAGLASAVEARRANFGGELCALLKMYESEIFGKTPSLKLLDALAESIFGHLKKEFLPPRAEADAEAISAWLERRGRERGYDMRQAARDLNTNAASLQAACKKNFGASFAKCVFARKMLDAQEMLAGGASVAAAARALGYADAFAFSKAFKRNFGKSPKNYLKM